MRFASWSVLGGQEECKEAIGLNVLRCNVDTDTSMLIGWGASLLVKPGATVNGTEVKKHYFVSHRWRC